MSPSLSTTLRIYQIKVPCPGIHCGRSAFLHFEESVVELCQLAHPEAVLGTVACNHHPVPLLYEYRAEHLHGAVFHETRQSRARRLDVSDLVVKRVP